MKKRTMSIFISVLIIAGTLASPVLADGFIIIDPPPTPLPPDWSPWLTIRYHRVKVTIEDQIAITSVDQVFRNDGPIAAEGTYVFPLPPGAVIQKFLMWIDDQPVEGKILPAEEARAIYEDYVRQQQDPALLEYIGRDAVQARIFPIPPGEERRIELEYTQVLPLENALMHYTYPLDTERFSAQPLEQVSIITEIHSQRPLGALYSSTHQDDIAIQRQGERQATISYEASHLLPDRNFELYIGHGDEPIAASLLTYQPDEEDGFFLLLLSPRLKSREDRIQPRDLFLILDTSGSMEGEKLDQAKEALNYILHHLNPQDRFNIITFSSGIHTYANRLQPVSAAEEAASWVADIEALGGTNIYLALSEALQQANSERTTVIIFLTDGLPTEGIIEEESILNALRQETPDTVRIFPFGVGYDVNTLLLDQLAEDNKGRPSYVEPGERIDETVSAFYSQIQSPLLMDINLNFGQIDAYDLYPQPLPDLYAGTQLVVAGRYQGSGPQQIELSGMVEGEQQTFIYEGNFVADSGKDFIPRLWAARKIGHLLTQIRLHGEEQEWIDAIVTLSLRYGIITPYTSFLIEEESSLTAEGREKAADELLSMPTPAPYGEEAVQDAQTRLGLGGAQAPPAAMEIPPLDLSTGAKTPVEIRYVGDKAFICKEGTCTDTRFVPDQMELRNIRFGSETYWKLIAQNSEWARYLALAPAVIFVAEDETAYHVQNNETIEEDEIPDLPQELAPPTPQATAIPALTSTPEPQNGPGLCNGAILLGIVGLAMGILIIRRQS